MTTNRKFGKEVGAGMSIERSWQVFILVEGILCEQKYHYENMPIQIYWKFYHQKWNFSDKNSDISHIYAQNIECGYSLEPLWWGGSNEYPQSMVLNRIKKNNVYFTM